jgi:acylglycerol lipase
MAGYRFGIRPVVPWTRHVDDVRWSLLAIEPAARRLRCGTFAATDGELIPYRLWLAKKPRAAIILLHGCCDYSGAFDAIGPRLARAGFAVLAYDQRGFGSTASRGKWAGALRIVSDLADAAGFLRARVHQTLPFFVIGESMGGAVAIHAAASQANLDVAGLVLVAPGALASPFRKSVYQWILSAFRAVTGDVEVAIERLDGEGLTDAAAIRLLGDPLVMRSITADVLEGVIGLAHSAVEAAREVAIPTLTMVGTRDDLLRRDCVFQLHQNLGGPKSWAAIKDGPHLLLHWEKGAKVLRTARKWIERHI